MTYPLTICNGYTIIEIGGKKFMLDSGAPMSFSVDPTVEALTLNGDTYDLPCGPMYKANLGLATGENISGIIGKEIIVLSFGVKCDLIHGTATFGRPPKESGHVVPLRDRKDFRVQVRVNGQEVIGYMDTGAPNAMIADPSLLDPTRYEGEDDEPTITEIIRTEKYGGEMELDGVRKNVTLRKLPLGWAPTPYRDVQAYFSVSTFAEQYYSIDPNNYEVRFL